MRCCLIACVVSVAFAVCFGLPDSAFAGSSSGVLSLEQAIQKAMSVNPDIIAFKKEIERAKARQKQAGLYPNPNLAFELDGFGGSGPFSGTENAQRTVSLEQDILLGGKIKKRRQMAAEQIETIRWKMKSLEQDVRQGVTKAFVEVAGAQRALDLQQDLVDLSGRVYDTVLQKADAGKVSPVEALKAEIELKNNRQALQLLKRRLERARKNLGFFWGTAEPDFRKVRSRLDRRPDLPALAVLEAGFEKNPDIVRFAAEQKLQKARYNFERARRIPDLSVSGGYRQIPETDDTAFIAEITIPLNIFDRNQGNIEGARQAMAQVSDRRAATLNRLRQQLNAAFQDALAAEDEILSLEKDIIPATRKVFSAKKQGYQNGKFPFLELLDAQRVLFESQQRYNDALVAYHLAMAEIERLTGNSIE
ncbi:cobalt-zinc-cadmium efflux system outer membrane protein [Desulfosalsimonas propionicica]|uniref:Cobalt-zinc-cadmium efflux system outer membrane protein n=1 Tax=Desulfosalsimonas propionicica TaxID=332175 RepID=A0A7W0C9Z5_9BACT|nr:TolC family protein [Desulfosalsimonas propionicica]MBA2881893.1 cobalt-zinc-cadmium efflux system outer membrane protein [Desulfosalsimonas propionicica]